MAKSKAVRDKVREQEMKERLSTRLDFYLKLKKNISGRDYSANQLATEAGLSQSQVSEWMRGENIPRIPQAETLQKVLGLTCIDDLFTPLDESQQRLYETMKDAR